MKLVTAFFLSLVFSSTAVAQPLTPFLGASMTARHGSSLAPITHEKQIAYADPTIVRVGSTFYLTGTAYERLQGFSVLKSKDLKTWTPVGRLLTEGKQVYGDKGFWAPQFYKNGKT